MPDVRRTLSPGPSPMLVTNDLLPFEIYRKIIENIEAYQLLFFEEKPQIHELYDAVSYLNLGIGLRVSGNFEPDRGRFV